MPILKQDVSYITGAASGLGKALAEHLAAQGGRVVIIDLNEANAIKLAEDLNAKHGASDPIAIAVKANTTVWEEQLAAWEAGIKAFGRIDYVFANAGIAEVPWVPVTFKPEEPITKPNFMTLDIDLIGQLNTAALAVQSFERQAIGPNGFKGKLILTSSVFGYYPCETMPMYAASKAAVVNFMRSSALFYANKKITINSMAPNLIATPIAPESLFKPFHERQLLTPIELVINEFDKLLGTSTTNGAAVSCNKTDVWVHPQDSTKWEENKEACELISDEIGKMYGYPGY